MLRPFGIGAQPPQQLDLYIAHWIDVGVTACNRPLQYRAAIEQAVDLSDLRDHPACSHIFSLDSAENLAGDLRVRRQFSVASGYMEVGFAENHLCAVDHRTEETPVGVHILKQHKF